MCTGEDVQSCDGARYAQVKTFIGNLRKIHVHRSEPLHPLSDSPEMAAIYPEYRTIYWLVSL